MDTVNVPVPVRLSLDGAAAASARWRRLSVEQRNPAVVMLAGAPAMREYVVVSMSMGGGDT